MKKDIRHFIIYILKEHIQWSLTGFCYIYLWCAGLRVSAVSCCVNKGSCGESGTPTCSLESHSPY